MIQIMPCDMRKLQQAVHIDQMPVLELSPWTAIPEHVDVNKNYFGSLATMLANKPSVSVLSWWGNELLWDPGQRGRSIVRGNQIIIDVVG